MSRLVALAIVALVLLAACSPSEGASPPSGGPSSVATPPDGSAGPGTPPPTTSAITNAIGPAHVLPGAGSETPTPVPTVSPTPVPVLHPAPYVIAIEAGHGGPSYWGASTWDSDGKRWIEKDVVLDIALRLADRLAADEQGRYVPVLIRDGDYTLTPWDPSNYRGSLVAEAQARADVANAAQADVYLAVHLNAWGDAGQAGTETYYNPDRSFGGQSYGLAWYVQEALVRHIRAVGYDVRDRGLKNDGEVNGDPQNEHSFALGTNANFNPTLMPGVISESLFLSSPTDLEFLRKPEALDVIADAYKDALDSYFAWLVSPP